MNGINMHDMDEVELELTHKEATAIRVALGYALSEFRNQGCQDTRKTMSHLYIALGKLGVKLDG